MNEGKPVMLTGIKPSGELHIGNYFGAMKPLVELSKNGDYQTFVMVADYHALNTLQDAAALRAYTHDLVTAYLAVGLDADDIVLFKQSEVQAHTELAWIFEAITTMPYLMRAHAFKAALDRAVGMKPNDPMGSALRSKILEAGDEFDLNVGTFNYPMLMAADILLYDAKTVPVGQDQKQHIEYARDTAEKFNRVFNSTVFSLPEAHILPDVAVVPGTDGQKMSKSYGNVIPLFASKEELTKRVMGIVTDSSGERPQNVYAMHTLVKTAQELEPLYEANAGSYKALKEALIEDLDAYFAPMRERYEALRADTGAIEAVLAKGRDKARAVAEKKMAEVRSAIGVA